MMKITGPENMGQYLSDESSAFTARAQGITGIFLPEAREEIASLARIAWAQGQFINISGAGTGITGSRVPMHGGIVLSMEKMLSAEPRTGCSERSLNGLGGTVKLYLDESAGLAYAGPGVTLKELAAALPRHLIYPPDPTETLASLGGTVSTNASGARSFYYGPTRDWIQGLKVVLPDGETVNALRGNCLADSRGILEFASESGKPYMVRIPGYRMPRTKNSAGLYSNDGMDLVDLFVGSEGILGIFAEITMKLHRAESEPMTDLAFFESQDNALGLVGRLRPMKDSGILAMEYFDGNSLDFVRHQYPEIPDKASAAVMIDVIPGNMDMLGKMSRLLAESNSLEDWCANNTTDCRGLKEFRHSIPDSVNTYLKQHDSYKLGTDFAVPRGRFLDMMAAYNDAGRRYRTRFPRKGPHFVIFGHIGDCHVHFNFITSNREEQAYARELYIGLAAKAIEMGGTVSAEHGVGKKAINIGGMNRPYLELMYGLEGIREIARVKAALDPRGILNPGNMFPVGFGEA